MISRWRISGAAAILERRVCRSVLSIGAERNLLMQELRACAAARVNRTL